ncbi:unnamed protein product [Rotaria sordida]|uniref:Nuclear receptor domain-containing protein n=1 Tax=Rotaria sordida TaxID=392033 RepID=A0A813XGC5_9BILA|nr:unnamed protein product [Rotaria sordida]CAF3755212.1 unnamed protein product [Rotaria sordida]
MKKSLSKKSTDIKRRLTKVTSECKVCGAPAKYSSYGAVACDACKTFFKRNGEHAQEVLKCDWDSHCEVNVNNRHVCSYCRLMKCFASGMQTGMIRGPYSKKRETHKKRKEIDEHIKTPSTALVPLTRPEQFPTLNLLQSDQSTLTVEQWNLLSNVSHCYDEYSGLSIGEHYMLEQDKLPLKFRFKTTSIIELYQKIFDGAPLLYTNNRDFLSLSVNDRSTLLSGAVSYATNLSGMCIVRKIGLTNYPAYFDAVGIITHPNIISSVRYLAYHFKFDIIIMKLFLVILSFSTLKHTVYSHIPSENLSDIKQILHIQDTYIEVAWKYLLYKYNHEQVVKCFSNFIRCTFVVHDAIVTAQDVQWYTNAIDSIIQQTEQTLTLDE